MWTRSLLGLVPLSICLIFVSRPADAARIETGAGCSLAEAISSANNNLAVGGCVAGDAGSDTVVVTGAVTLSAPDNGSNGLPVVIEDLVITSPQFASNSSIRRDGTVGTPDFRLLEIGTLPVIGTPARAPAVTLRRLNLANGRVLGSIAPGSVSALGGCVLLSNGSLTVVESVIEECAAVGADNPTGSGSSAWGGAIAVSVGSLSIRDSSFSFNTATGGSSFAAGQPGGSADGGALFGSGSTSLLIRDTSISSNFATGGMGITRAGNGRGGGLAFFGTEAQITRTAFTANAASGGVATNGTSGTGIGGGISVEGGALILADSEVVANVANGAESSGGLAGYAKGGGLYGWASDLTLIDATVSNNRANGGSGAATTSDGLPQGGGLYLFETTASLDGVAIEANAIEGASPQGAGVIVLHGSSPATPFLMIRSSVVGNSALATDGSAQGGGVYQDGDTVTLRSTAIMDNAANIGGGLFQKSGSTSVLSSTLSSNTASWRGGAVATEGTLDSTNLIDLANATVSGNAAGLLGGGLDVVSTQLSPGLTVVQLKNVTITENSNGGIRLEHDRSDPVLEVGNTIVGAQASGSDCVVDGSASITSEGGNLESGTSCGFSAGSDQQSVADLGLAAIGSNGGTTLTHELLAGSPAIDAGRARICKREANDKDQRGLARFYDGNGDRDFACDSGAVKSQGLLGNPGFEERLDAATDWTLVASGGGDGRTAAAGAPSGRFALALQANGALESASQNVPVAGGTGESFALTLLCRGAGMVPGEALEMTLRSKLADAAVDVATCTFSFPAADFSSIPASCALTTTGTVQFA